MSTEVWYRKWRPQRFGDVAGQEQITRTLANAVASDRLAHAYLFCGPRGTGKTSTARILAKAANCRKNQDGEPCNVCDSCREVSEGRALDLVEMDAASNRGIDEIRSLRDKVGYSPNSSTYKVYLIDEVHELTAHAFDALLKTIEEPPSHVIFVLATTEAERVPATIVSRCQRYDFRRIRVADVVGRLAQVCEGEGVTLPESGAELIARRATGSLRDAINLLEQVVAACGDRPDITQLEHALGFGGAEFAARLARHALAAELADAFRVIAGARDEGVEPRQLLRSAVDRLRSLLLVRAGAESTLELGDEAIADLRGDAEGSDLALVLRLLRALSAADFRGDALSSLPLELALAQAIIEPPPAVVVPPQPAAAAINGGRGERPVSVPRPQQATYSAPRPAAPATSPRAVRDGDPSSESVAARPADAPAPAAAAPASFVEPVEPLTGELTVELLQGLMATIYARLKSERRSITSALINSKCNIMALDDEQVTIAFAHDTLAAKFRDGAGEHITAVEDAIESLSGRRYRLQISVDPAVEDWHRTPATVRTSHLLDQAVKLGLRREQ